MPGLATAGLATAGPAPAARPGEGTTGDWTASAAVSHLSFTLQAPAWHHPPAESAAPPLVIVGHDYVPPPSVEAAPQPVPPPAAVDAGWTAGLSADDPFARLLAGLSPGQPDAIWPG